MDKRNPVRIGILGTGRIAVDAHVRDIRAAGGTVAAMADTAPGRAARHAQLLGVPAAFLSLDDMLRSGTIDAVDVCTPPVTHLPAVLAALDAGCPVYLEKPPAMNRREMETMAAASVRAGLPLVTGTNQVFYPAVRFAKAMIDSGEAGIIYAVECHKTIRRFYRKGWHRSRAVAGGGVVMDSSTHRMDLALHLLSNPEVQSVSARTFSYFAGLDEPEASRQSYLVMDEAERIASGLPAPDREPVDVEDSVFALFRLAGGGVLSLREMVGVNMPDETVLRIYGTKAGLVLRMAGPGAGTVSVYAQDGSGMPVDRDPPPEVTLNTEGSHTGAFRHFFQCVRGETDFRPGLDRAVRLMGMVDAIYASAGKGGAEMPIL
ncbi:MAG: Gfo/Idh/MocA family oxidoreductase [Clostridia bacterium]|nr:Gfo/Idh/MocA family oxidoreductase [Clostridia bacterium]